MVVSDFYVMWMTKGPPGENQVIDLLKFAGRQKVIKVGDQGSKFRLLRGPSPREADTQDTPVPVRLMATDLLKREVRHAEDQTSQIGAERSVTHSIFRLNLTHRHVAEKVAADVQVRRESGLLAFDVKLDIE